MKIRKSLITIIIFIFSGLLLVSCKQNNTSSSDISLDFLITPQKMVFHSNDQLIALNKAENKAKANIKLINEKYSDLSKISEKDIKIQEEIHNEIRDVLNSGKTIENKSTIENIFNHLRELKGDYVDSFEDDIVAKIYLVEDTETSSVVSLENAYIRMLILLKDGNMIIPKGIMSDSKTELKPTGKIGYIRIKLPDKLKDELEKLVEV
ncbi:hypothetical protein [Tissierella creatinophila]|uniref:Uncharacterized protein n=1 Tax=Tissierella creatinophila DSM 6911 TaxID=1123403 RepID=A0A1U7M6X7_TISCR|nr:hypothetical protein [Tissierella creatinophila]OLS02948.1 hypothetical protein TICRE_10050 [Tissierella creatinophila DSM 6911]